MHALEFIFKTDNCTTLKKKKSQTLLIVHEREKKSFHFHRGTQNVRGFRNAKNELFTHEKKEEDITAFRAERVDSPDVYNVLLIRRAF